VLCQPEDLKLNAVARYLLPQDVRLDLDVANKRQLFHAIGQHMHREHGLSPDEVVLNLSRREQAGSTGLGEGVAIPHARVGSLDRTYAFYARLKSPIPFDSPDGRPVSDVLVLLVPRPASEEHLEILADAMQVLSDRRFRKRLHASVNPSQIVEVFREAATASAASL
jgi:nitrogen PTS system EIIA component